MRNIAGSTRYPRSAAILAANRRYIPGGVVSVNRAVQPEIVFTKGQGAHIWDADGNEYVDFHFAFAPHILGHNDPYVSAAVERTIRSGASLFGTGTTVLEGRLAELICTIVPGVESVQFLNSGSEATSQALRLARAATGREHIIVMQGGYNGWHDDVACNLMTPLAALGPRVSPGEYPFCPTSAGIPESRARLIHAVNFNDLPSVQYVAERYPIAALITEPVLQNVGVVKPMPGYLQGLRDLADEFGFVLVFDEVKTGFRHGLRGYAASEGVRPDLAVFGKALANGYPIAALGGRRCLMDYFVHPQADKRVLLAGTYNAHPVPTAAAVATIERLMANDGAVYGYMECLGDALQRGIEEIVLALGVPGCVSRLGSALCLYFTDEPPNDWHDIAMRHPFDADEAFRRALIERGVYFFPLATKQCSLSAAHSEADIERTLAAAREAMGAAAACLNAVS